jgi:hypothetical protein
MAFTNNSGQTRVGVRLPLNQVTQSTLMASIYSVYNAETTVNTLGTGLYSVYGANGNTNDELGNYNGTAVGSLTYTTGKIGNAFSFNGSNAHIDLPSGSFNFNSDFSISLWVKFNSTTNATIFDNLNQSTSDLTTRTGYSLYTQSGRIRFATYANNTNIVESSTALTTGTWYHIVVRKPSNGVPIIYLNGVLQTLGTISGTPSINPTYVAENTTRIGVAYRVGSYSNRLNGIIDSVSTWTKALRYDEVIALYNSGNSMEYPYSSVTFNSTLDALGTYNGTAKGGLTYTTGKIGQAFNLNGTNAYVELGDVMDIGLDSWSYACWINTNSTASQQIFSKSFAGGQNGRFAARIFNGVDVRFLFEVTGVNVLDVGLLNANVVNEWTHYVFIVDRSDKVKIYRNGVLTSPTVISGTNNLTPYIGVNFGTQRPFRIGANTASDGATPGSFFSGQIDSLNIWNRVLTESEITELYNSGNGKQYPF